MMAAIKAGVIAIDYCQAVDEGVIIGYA